VAIRVPLIEGGPRRGGFVQRLVIIGNSAAGLAAIEAIRSRDRRSRITLIAAETHPPYSRVMLTYLLAGKVRPDELFLHGPDWYERMGVEALAGHRAVAIDTRLGHVFVERAFSGRTPRRIPYDRLLIATGALAQRPALPGIDLPGVFCLRDLDDAVAILRYAEADGMLGESTVYRSTGCHGQPPMESGLSRAALRGRSLWGESRGLKPAAGRRAVFLGGGPVCLQALTALAGRGMRVVLLVRSPQILSQLADRYTAGLAERALRAGGVRVLTRADPVGIEAGSGRSGPPLRVHLRDRRRVPTDLVIIGKGTQPNLELVRGTAIATDVGILVDETLQTSVPGVFAAGDVAQATHCVSGRKVCFGTWSNACEQGRIAGLNMIGVRMEWRGGLNRNITTLFGNTLASVGLPLTDILPVEGLLDAAIDGGGAVRETGRGRGLPYRLHTYRDPRRDVSRRLLFREGRCEGAVLWNACDDLGVLSSLISTRRDCHGWEDRLTRGDGAFGDVLRSSLVQG
jgi:nitrite reductase (NADH) large subunit